jgi:aldose 1-epimerase
MTVMGGRRVRQASGDQYAIAWGGSEAQISQVGATLRTFAVDGLDAIDGFPSDERCTDGRGQVLAPWPNRLTDGQYHYDGRDCQAPLNEPSRHGAIHGLVRWFDWTLVESDAASVTLACVVRPQPGYEWQLDLEITYALDDTGLAVTFRATNADREPAPFGVGFHPYLTLATTTVDGLELTVPATALLDPDAPADRPTMMPVASTPLDFTQPRRIGALELDSAFGELAFSSDGRAVARLANPENGRWVELWVDDRFRYLMVYTADRVARPERRRAAVAVEPMTCPPNALRTGLDLVELAPGASWRGTWGLRTGHHVPA